MIRYAKTDSAVKGIYIKANSNGNGLGTTEEIRNALLDFKKSGKFIYAYGDVISLRAYYAANVADQDLLQSERRSGMEGTDQRYGLYKRRVWTNSKFSPKFFMRVNSKVPLNPCVRKK